jgi:hypothetical protein
MTIQPQPKKSKSLIFIVLGAVIAVLLAALILGFAFTQNEKAFCNIQVTEAALYASDVNGSSYYVLEVNAFYSGQNSWSINPTNFKVIANSSTAYSETSSTDIPVNPMQNVKLTSGQNQTGQIAFLISNGQTASKLVYNDKVLGINLEVDNLPQVSSWFSKITGVAVSEAWFNSESASIPNASVWYKNGEIVTVEFKYTYAPTSPFEPSWMVIHSISSQENFETSSLSVSLPTRIPAAQTVQGTIGFVVPNSVYHGDLHLLADITT